MVKGFDLRRGRGKAARVRLQGVGGTLLLLPVVHGEIECSPAGYLAPLRRTLIDDNKRQVNVVVCESDYCANLQPGMQ